MNLTKIKIFEKIFCPFCREEMMADVHNKKPTWYDNWWCNDCEVMISPEDLFNIIPKGDNNKEWLEKMEDAYKPPKK